MTSKKMGFAAVLAAGFVAVILFTNVLGQAPTTPAKPAAPAATGKDVTMTGKVIDLHSFCTGQMASADAAKCTADCIRSGVPAALETPTGLIILGQGPMGPSKAILPFAFQNVEAKGKLYEKGGVKYLDVSAITKAGN